MITQQQLIDMQALKVHVHGLKTKCSKSSPIVNISTFYRKYHIIWKFLQMDICPSHSQCDVIKGFYK